MKVLVVGGGSGGHVTPVVAVVHEIYRQAPRAQIRFWCDYGFYKKTKAIVEQNGVAIPVERIVSGKFRRYHTLPIWRQLLRPVSIILPNLRDMLFVGIGVLQSVIKLLLYRPDVVFTKGGFVCLPVGIAAKILGIPIVIHDSDAHPGLTNRILARWAAAIATGAPLDSYPSYPKSISRYVGIPIHSAFRPFTAQERRHMKKELGFEVDRPLVVVTGGGLGARRLNDATIASLDSLLPQASLLLLSGSIQYDELKALTPRDARFQLEAFISSGMENVLGAADIVVARAGATTILELAALAKPTILIPNPYLTGGHQLKNATVYAKCNAVLVVDEQKLAKDSSQLVVAVQKLLQHPAAARKMAEVFHTFAKPDAARVVAGMIIAASKQA